MFLILYHAAPRSRLRTRGTFRICNISPCHRIPATPITGKRSIRSMQRFKRKRADCSLSIGITTTISMKLETSMKKKTPFNLPTTLPSSSAFHSYASSCLLTSPASSLYGALEIASEETRPTQGDPYIPSHSSRRPSKRGSFFERLGLAIGLQPVASEEGLCRRQSRRLCCLIDIRVYIRFLFRTHRSKK